MKKIIYWGFMIGYTLGFSFGVVNWVHAEDITQYWSNYSSNGITTATNPLNTFSRIYKYATSSWEYVSDYNYGTSNIYSICFNSDPQLRQYLGQNCSGGSGYLGFSDGTYKILASSTQDYLIFTVDNTLNSVRTSSEPTTDTSTRIISLTYSTSTSIATGQYYFNTGSSTPIINFNVTDPLSGIVTQETIQATSTGYVNYGFYVPTSQATSTTGFNYLLYTDITSYETCTGDPFFGYTCTDPNAPILDSTTTVAVLTPYDLGDPFYRASLIMETVCDINHIGGCLRNFSIWAIYPDDNAKNSFLSLKTTLEKKSPVGYFYIVKNNLSMLNSSSTPVFTFVLPDDLKNNVFDPFKTSIAIFLWFFFLIHMYKRLKHITV